MSEIQIQKERILKSAGYASLLLLSALAIMVDPSKMNLNQNVGKGLTSAITLLYMELRPVEVAHILAVMFLFVLYKRVLLQGKKSFCLGACIVACILSSFLLIGMSLEACTDFSFIIGRKSQMFIALLTFLGFWIILYGCVKWLYVKLDCLKVKTCFCEGVWYKVEQHFFVIAFIALLLCWGILSFAFFPGSVPYDGRNELNQYFGITQLNLHHPFFSTMILGLWYEIGYKIAGITGGCVAYVMFQSLCGAVVFGRIAEYVCKKTKRLLFGGLTLLYFGMVPVWWAYMQSIMKDALYVVAFAWFMLEYFKIFFKDNNKYTLMQLAVAGVFACILRNGAWMLILPTLIALWIACKGIRKSLVAVIAVVLIINYGLNTVLMDKLDLKSDNQVEALSIPLQQIARYVTVHEDEMTDEEKKVIDGVIRYDGISERYNPECSDPIKDKNRREATDEDWQAFWKLWLEKFKDDPITYITATMNHVYGYIDPFHFYYGLVSYQFYNKDAITEEDKDIVYSKYLFPYNIRRGVSSAVYMWDNIPGLSFLVNAGFYTWVGIILIGALLRKKKWKTVLMFVAPFMNVLMCFASPVNALLRYALPVMAMMPLLILVSLDSLSIFEKESKDGINEES